MKIIDLKAKTLAALLNALIEEVDEKNLLSPERVSALTEAIVVVGRINSPTHINNVSVQCLKNIGM